MALTDLQQLGIWPIRFCGIFFLAVLQFDDYYKVHRVALGIKGTEKDFAYSGRLLGYEPWKREDVLFRLKKSSKELGTLHVFVCIFCTIDSVMLHFLSHLAGQCLKQNAGPDGLWADPGKWFLCS